MRLRVKKLIRGIAVILLIGFIYAIWCITTHLYIPCVFHLITGLKCPGCGVTGMMVSLIRFDFTEAFRCNAALMILLPFAVFFAVRRMIIYVKYGHTLYQKWENISIWICIILLILFAIIRNLPFIPISL